MKQMFKAGDRVRKVSGKKFKDGSKIAVVSEGGDYVLLSTGGVINAESLELVDDGKISMSKQYKTRAGNPVRLLCTDRKHNIFPVIGLVTKGDRELAQEWTEKGYYFSHGRPDSDDLIEVLPLVGISDMAPGQQGIIREVPCATFDNDVGKRVIKLASGHLAELDAPYGLIHGTHAVKMELVDDGA